ncbi:ABC transporter permease [Lacticaseibacillus parakribbianus]|uniref:ABC transporter permease n=1 Tax=Lacticaseibacillus parakribbianus TaxID=2970927 RepID=UPI0021CB5D15|nr:ABC transporter permease [Lacticaseibacillus parakribbianus]
MLTLKQLAALTGRIIRQNFTNGDTLVTVIAMPVFMLLFFVYVLGGSIVTAGGAAGATQYLDYALPGFVLLTMAMGSAYTALRINNDQTSGFLSRLHALPIPRWVILGAHLLASVVFMVAAAAAVLLVGCLMGYRSEAGLGGWLAFAGLAVLFALTITLLAIPFSLKASNYASAGGFSYVLLMLLFVSSALMPTRGMAGPVRAFATHQPMTPIVNAARGLLAAGTAPQTLPVALAWLIGGAVVFAALAYWAYWQVFVKR